MTCSEGLTDAEILVSLDEILKTEITILISGEATCECAADNDDFDHRLLKPFGDLRKLSKRDRNAVILLIDSALPRGDVEERLKRRA